MSTASDLDLLRAQGEGYLVEFKESPTDLERDICAFANASGGTIYLGIADNGTLKTVSLTNRLRAQLQVSARNLDPPQEISIRSWGPLVAVSVRESENKPVRASQGFYLRVGAISQKLSREEILAFAVKETKLYFDSQLYVEAPASVLLNIRQIETFRQKAGLEVDLENLKFLENLGCLKVQKNTPFLTFGGILLFGDNPQKIFPQTTLTLLHLEDPTTILEQKILKGTLFMQVEAAFQFLKSQLSSRPEIKGLSREEHLEIPEGVLRELLVNAVVHRDYFERSSDIVIKVFPTHIEFSNPGLASSRLPLNQIYGRSFRRNPLIADFFYRANYIERAGTGLLRVRQILEREGLPPLRLAEEGPFFIATITRPGAIRSGPLLNNRQKELLGLQRDFFPFATPDYARRFSISERMARFDIQAMIQEGLLQVHRKGRQIRYGLKGSKWSPAGL